jgi:hypothetical protein
MRPERLQVKARRIKNKLISAFTPPKVELTEEVQIDGLRIINKLICEPNTTLRYIYDKRKYTIETEKYYIQIFDKSVIIQNGKFSYHIDFPEDTIEEIKALFNRVIEKRDRVSQQKYNDRTAKNLKEVLQELNSQIC